MDCSRNQKRTVSSLSACLHRELPLEIIFFSRKLFVPVTESWRSFRLALYLDYRYLSSADAYFVDLIQSDIESFLKTDISDRVLIFPPINNYHRFLIHKTIENEYPNLKSFSVGEGDNRRTAVCLKSIIKSDWIEEQSMSAPSPSSRGRGRGRHRDDSNPKFPTVGGLQDENSSRHRDDSSPKFPTVGGLQDENSKSVEILQMEMRTVNAGRGRARPERSKVKRPDVQVYVPPSRRQQQQQEIIQEEITPEAQKSSKSSHGKTKPGVQMYVHPHQKSVQEKAESAENWDDSINNSFLENSRANEIYQAGSIKGVQQMPVDIISVSSDGDGHVQKKSVIVSQSDEWSHLDKKGTLVESPTKTVKKQKTSHQKKSSCNSDVEITEDGDIVHNLSTRGHNSCTKEEESRYAHGNLSLDASFEEIKNVSTIGLSDTQLPNRNQNKSIHHVMTVSQERTTSNTEIDGSIGSGQYLAERISNAKNVESGVCVNSATSEKASDKLTCIRNSHIPCTSHRSAHQISNKSWLQDQQEVANTDITVNDQFSAHSAKLDISTISDANKVVLDCETIDGIEDSFPSNSEVKVGKDSLFDFSSTTVCGAENGTHQDEKSNPSQIIHLDQLSDLQDLMEQIRDDSKITTDEQDSFGGQPCSSGQLNEEGIDHIPTVASNQDPENHSLCEHVINKEIHLQQTFSDSVEQSPEVTTKEQKQAELESHPEEEQKQIDGDSQIGGKTTESKNESYTDENGKSQTGGQSGDRTDLMLEVQEKKIVVYGKDERSGVQTEAVSQSACEEEDINEDSWDIMFGEDGECLDPKAMDELTKAVGKVKIEKAKINYLEYSPREPQMNYDSYAHIIEIYDFPKEFITRDLIAAFQSFVSRGFDIKWVDDTHALGVFSSAIAAQSALSMIHPLLKVCPLSEASQQSKSKAKRCTEFLQPYKPRPESSAAVARRLVTGALGLAPPNISKEKREQERKQLQEARAKKRHEKKERDEIWEGTYGKCAMDAEPS